MTVGRSRPPRRCSRLLAAVAFILNGGPAGGGSGGLLTASGEDRRQPRVREIDPPRITARRRPPPNTPRWRRPGCFARVQLRDDGQANHHTVYDWFQ